MDEGNTRQRIEIELTEHADSGSGGRWRRGRHDEAPPAGLGTYHSAVGEPPAGAAFVSSDDAIDGHTPAPWANERRRLLVTALTAGVIALFVGWALGRSGGSDPDEASGADATETTRPERASDDDAPQGSPVPTVRAEDLPRNTRPFTPIVEAGPTTTVAPAWTDSTVPIDPATAPIGLELIAGTSAGIEVLDLATGESSSYPGWTTAWNSQRPIYAGDDWILVYNPESQRAALFEGEAERQDISFGSNQQMMFDPARQVFVSIEQSPMTAAADTTVYTLRELAHDGSEPTAETRYELPANSWIQSLDPAGGVIVYGASGGVYHADIDGSQRLTSGQLISVSATTAVVSECGDILGQCDLNVVDRASGQRRVLRSPDGSPLRFEPTYSYFGSLMATMSPTDEYIAVISPLDDWSLGLLSLVDGTFVELSRNYNDPQVHWSPDGRYAVYVDGDKLNAYDTVAKLMLEDIAPFASVRSFTTRPA